MLYSLWYGLQGQNFKLEGVKGLRKMRFPGAVDTQGAQYCLIQEYKYEHLDIDIGVGYRYMDKLRKTP